MTTTMTIKDNARKNDGLFISATFRHVTASWRRHGQMSRDSLRRRTASLQSPRLIHAMCLYQHCSRRSVKAKFHHAILVADRSEAGRTPVADLLARASSC